MKTFFQGVQLLGTSATYLNGIIPPSIINDGNTVAWYISDDLTTITKDGSNLVSQWNDKLGSGHDLLQPVTNQPLWSADGILFDGISQYMKTVAFTLVQPEMIYLVFRQNTWIFNKYICDGNAGNSGVIRQIGSTPLIGAWAGSDSPNISLSIAQYGILRVLFNGASSNIIINNETPGSGDFGSANMGGFTLGGSGSAINFSNIQVKEIILRNVADSAQDEQDIYNYLAAKYSI